MTIRELAHNLTPEELAERGRELARAVEEERLAEDNAKAVRAKVREEKKLIRERIRKLSRAVETGVDLREVECEERPDESKLEMVLVRIDTGAELGRRAMTAEERQTGLPVATGGNVSSLEGARKKGAPAFRPAEPAEPEADPGDDFGPEGDA